MTFTLATAKESDGPTFDWLYVGAGFGPVYCEDIFCPCKDTLPGIKNLRNNRPDENVREYW